MKRRCKDCDADRLLRGWLKWCELKSAVELCYILHCLHTNRGQAAPSTTSMLTDEPFVLRVVSTVGTRYHSLKPAKAGQSWPKLRDSPAHVPCGHWFSSCGYSSAPGCSVQLEHTWQRLCTHELERFLAINLSFRKVRGEFGLWLLD